MKTHNTEHLTANEFSDQFAKLLPGESLVYATGELAGSIARSSDRAELVSVGKAAMTAQIKGTACLTQRRLGPRPTGFAFGLFEYRATKRQQQ